MDTNFSISKIQSQHQHLTPSHTTPFREFRNLERDHRFLLPFTVSGFMLPIDSRPGECWNCIDREDQIVETDHPLTTIVWETTLMSRSSLSSEQRWIWLFWMVYTSVEISSIWWVEGDFLECKGEYKQERSEKGIFAEKFYRFSMHSVQERR